MDMILGSSASSSNRSIDNDKNKKHFYNNTRRHYAPFQSMPSANAWQRRLLSPAKGLFSLIALTFTVFVLFSLFRHSKKTTHHKLSDQPTYTKHDSTCSVILCNPSKRCSTWLPNKSYTWSDLSQAGVFRDLSTIQVGQGCELHIKMEGMDEGEWLTIPQGSTECVDSGYGTKCRNFVEMELKANILTLANQMKSIIKERSSQSQEVILVQHAATAAAAERSEVDVTMISQFSVNRLDTFTKAIEVWKGPVSAAIYLTQPTDIDELVEYFEVQKNLDAYAQVTLTLVKPNYLSQEHLAYPINHLRNIAIRESSTDYIFVLDADFAPSVNLYEYLTNRLVPYITYNKTPLTAWVIPCFAIREGYEHMPHSYDELRTLVGRDIAYITDPGAGHGPTLATEVSMVRPLLMGNPLAYEVCFESQWEPYYILHRSAPLYDARFKNQGGDKQSHALHLNAAGYRFMVLREVFMIHKDHSKMVWPGGGFEKAQKAAKKWNYFEEFMHEMKTIYGGNPRWPKGCSAVAIGWQDQRRDTLGLAAGAA